MRRNPFGLFSSLGLMAAMAMPMLSSGPEPAIVEERAARPSSKKKVARRRMIAGGYKLKRSKGAQAARKGKSNRNLISKRTRRKHRRAA